MRGLGLAVVGVLALAPSLARAGDPCARDVNPKLEAFKTRSPTCPPDRATCVGLFVHVVVVDGQPVQEPEWFAIKVEHANRLFEAIDVGFQVVGVDAVNSEHEVVATRTQRDQIGRKVFQPGVAHIFVVGQLDDVDKPGEVIRGVHWRQRGDRSKRWVILSSISGTMVLAHELGHFFGLPHSRYDESVMNKAPRDDPPWEARVFAEPEIPKMLARRDEMLGTEFLHRCPVAKASKPAPAPEPEVDPFVAHWTAIGRRALVRRLAPAAFAWMP